MTKNINITPETTAETVQTNDFAGIMEKLSQTLEIVANNTNKNIVIKTGGTELGFKAFKAVYDELRDKANDQPDMARVYHELIRFMDRSRGTDFGMNYATTLTKDILALINEFPEVAHSQSGAFTVLIIISSLTARLDAQINSFSNHRSGNGKHKNNRNNGHGRSGRFASNDKNNEKNDPKIVEAIKKLST